MGQTWNAENRALGFQLEHDDPILIWGLKIIGMTGHGIFRFFAGRPLFGDRHRKTDATFTRAGTKLIHPNARPPFRWLAKDHTYCWSALAEWRRALIRLGLLVLTVAGPWAYYGGGGWVQFTGSLALILLLFHARAIRAAKDWRHRRSVVKPLEAAIAPILGQTPRETVVRIPRRRMKGAL